MGSSAEGRKIHGGRRLFCSCLCVRYYLLLALTPPRASPISPSLKGNELKRRNDEKRLVSLSLSFPTLSRPAHLPSSPLKRRVRRAEAC
jgi:hypothetical protein